MLPQDLVLHHQCTVTVASDGTTAPVTGVTTVGGLTIAAKGGLEMGVGAVMLANA